MWKKIKQLLIPQSDESEKEESDSEFVVFHSKDPIDVLFTKNFVSGGGLFFYCENEQEALSNLKEIIENENIERMVCNNTHLHSYLNRLNIKYQNEFYPILDFAFIRCEYLIAFDGSIMLSSHQTKGRKQEDLPNNIIVYATPKQFASNINEALQKLNSRKGDIIPTTTSIRGRNIHNVDATASAKNIYLLLVEE